MPNDLLRMTAMQWPTLGPASLFLSLHGISHPDRTKPCNTKKRKTEQRHPLLKCVSCEATDPLAQRWRISRRAFSVSILLSLPFLTPNLDAMAGSFLDKYVKRKKLDPLEAYVPAVILAELQFKDLERTLDVDQPEYNSCRSLLRSGPAASLRINIRAVAQYASDAGNGQTALTNVDQCLRALEELDSLLLQASRKETDASVKLMRGKIVTALAALDSSVYSTKVSEDSLRFLVSNMTSPCSLLKTVPSDVLDKGKAMANAYREPDEVDDTPAGDPELKQLESLL